MEPKKELTLDESVAQVMQTLPPVIRDYLASKEYSVVAQHLIATYGLHVDQGGVLEREVMLLLMGIDTPDEFAQALADEARLDTATINSITRDVNEQIFVPLRKKMQEPVIKQAPKVVKPTPPPPAYILPQQRTIPANPSLPQRPSDTPVAVKSAQPEPPPFSVNKLSSGVYSIINHYEKMLLEDHEEPHIDIRSKAPVPSNLPGQMPPVNPQQWASNTTPRPVPPPSPRPVAPTPPAQPYSADPYREPLE